MCRAICVVSNVVRLVKYADPHTAGDVNLSILTGVLARDGIRVVEAVLWWWRCGADRSQAKVAEAVLNRQT